LSQELFDQLDSDRSGSISMKELSEGLRRQGYVLNDREIEQLMRK
jgi:calcium-dependent protein kinase